MTENEFLKKLFHERDGLGSEAARAQFDKSYFLQMKNPIVQYGYNYFLGWLGVDKFTMGNNGAGFIKLALGLLAITSCILGGIMVEEQGDAGALLFLGIVPVVIWVIVDWFLTPGAARDYNARALDETVSLVRAGKKDTSQ